MSLKKYKYKNKFKDVTKDNRTITNNQDVLTFNPTKVQEEQNDET